MRNHFLSVVGLAILLAGCVPAPSSSKPGGVALIDLETAAKRLGRDVTITQELKDAGGALGEKLAAAQKEYQSEFEKMKDSLGTKPTEADGKKLAELGRNLNVQFQQKQQQAQQELAVKRLALVNRFREEIKPLAMAIAAKKGLGIVLVKSDVVVLGNEADLDITDEVVAEMTRIGGQSAPTPTATASPASN
jgi:Skp family chaperone for outer membrane proteins